MSSDIQIEILVHVSGTVLVRPADPEVTRLLLQHADQVRIAHFDLMDTSGEDSGPRREGMSRGRHVNWYVDASFRKKRLGRKPLTHVDHADRYRS